MPECFGKLVPIKRDLVAIICLFVVGINCKTPYWTIVFHGINSQIDPPYRECLKFEISSCVAVSGRVNDR